MHRLQPFLQENLLGIILEEGKRGRGSVAYFSSQDEDTRDAFLTELADIASISPEILDLSTCGDTPFAPFFYHLETTFSSLSDSQKKTYLRNAQIYHRHRKLFVPLDKSFENNPMEDPITDELFFEKMRLMSALERLLKTVYSREPRVLLIRHGELLSPEALEILHKETFWATLPVVVIVLKESEPRNNPGWQKSRDFWIRMDSAGRVIRILETDSPGMSGSSPLSSPDLDKIFTLIDWLCFDHALALGLDLKKSSMSGTPEDSQLLLAIALSYMGLENWDQSIGILEEFMEMSREGEKILGILLLSQCWKEKNDKRTALRILQPLIHEKQYFSPENLVRYYFLCYRLNLSESENSLFLPPTEEFIIPILKKIRWFNHQAFLLTQNNLSIEFQTKETQKMALEKLMGGLEISRKLKNQRRYTSGLHTLGHYKMKVGQFTEAAKIYQKALLGYRRYSSPLLLARMLNGFGYLYFTLGLYQLSLKLHREALSLLEGSRQYEEILTTLVNLSRVYLFSRQSNPGLELLSRVFQFMGNLQDMTLPFLSTQTLLANLGLCAIESGKFSQAMEIGRRLEEHFQKNPTKRPTEYTRLFFSRKISLGHDREKTRNYFKETADWLQSNLPFQYHLQIFLYSHWAKWEAAEGLPQESLRLHHLILDLPTAGDHFPWEKTRSLNFLEDKKNPDSPRLPLVKPDYWLLRELLEMDSLLLQLQRRIRELAFLQKWQQLLMSDLMASNHRRILCRMIMEQWGVEKVSTVFQKTSLFDKINLSPHQEIPNLSEPYLSAQIAIFPLGVQDGYGEWLVVETGEGQPSLTREDHKIFQLAVNSLNLVILAQEKNRQLETQRSELEVTLNNLNSAQDQLVQSEKMAALGGLVAGVAHEINTPLGVAVTGVTYIKEKADNLLRLFHQEVLKKSELEEFILALQEASSMVSHNLERAALLVQSFKQVAVDQSSEQRRKFNLKEYLAEILKSLAPKWKRTELVVNLEGLESLEMDSYPGAIAQIISNLLMNSLIHGFPSGGPGEINLLVNKTPTGQALIIHQDNGSGIAEAHLNKVFDPFFTTNRGMGGTGLGLHIVYNLVTQKLGGKIRLESTLGKGTVFYITLPMKTE